MLARVLLAGLMLFISQQSVLAANGFDMTADKFRAALNMRLKQDGRELISSCRSGRAQLICRFRGDPNAGAGGLLGHIDHSEHMTLEIDGKSLAQITLNGQRNSPAALRHFTGIVTSAVGALSPGADAGKIAGMVAGLGLARDDNSPNIGESMSQDAAFGTISCTSQYSKVATDVACMILPKSP